MSMTMSPVTFPTKIRDFAKVRSLFSRIGPSLFKYYTSSNRRLVECVRLQPLSTPKLGKERVFSAF